jgi:benzoate/toluate 1,2-dioxygenase subunit beta
MVDHRTSTVTEHDVQVEHQSVAAISREAVIDFVHYEAELADDHKHEEWLALWNPERASYVVPYPDDPGDGFRVAIVRDDYEHLCERIRHLSSTSAHAPEPPSRLCRVIGRVKVLSGEEGSAIATSNFVCVESRLDREVLWAGTTQHIVAPRRGTEGLELWRKEVHLVNAASEIPVLAFLV